MYAFFVGVSAVLQKPYLLELYYLFYLVLLFQALVQRGASVPSAGAEFGVSVRLNDRRTGLKDHHDLVVRLLRGPAGRADPVL